MKHFILTRFNLRLWPHNKAKEETQTENWLHHRVEIFEQYCLPSVSSQSCKDFYWILLTDSESPIWMRERQKMWLEKCPQIVVIDVKPAFSRKFTAIFRQTVKDMVIKYTSEKERENEIVVTTYLDNDDAIASDYVLDVQQKAKDLRPHTVISYKHGIQYFSELNFATRILFKYNHFISLVEQGTNIKTVFGYGGHYHIWEHKEITMNFVEPDTPKWMEVVHEKNVDNDVWMTFDTKPVISSPMKLFSLNEAYTNHPFITFVLRFIPRAIHIFFRHVKYKILGHDWWG